MVLNYLIEAPGLCNGPALNYFMGMTTTSNDDGASNEDGAPNADRASDPVATGVGNLAGPPCTNDALRRATRQLGLLYDEAFAPTGLKATQLGLMLQIERLTGDQGPTLHALAASVAVGVSALTYALRPLVRDGLVDLLPDLKDKRSKHAVLTALGRERLGQGARLWAEANQRVETLLGHADARLLRSLAERVSSDAFSAAFRNGLR